MKKTIWFDLSNSPHINLFSGIIHDLEINHNIIITTRPHGNSIQLLERDNLSFTIVGRYYKKGKIKKAYGFIKRIIDLYSFLKNKNIELAVSQSSFHSPPVSSLLGIKSIYMNDNEHAQGNIPAFLFATKIFLPEYFPKKVARKQLAHNKKIIFYPGLKEGIYLWNKEELQYKDKPERNTIYIRPEPWTALYYRSRSNFLDKFILEISNMFKVAILPRDDVQKIHYNQIKNGNITILERALTLNEIVKNCKLFIGAGGTMTRELAVLGFPTISVYQQELLEVDKYLINEGLLYHTNNIDLRIFENVLSKNKENKTNIKILEKGKQTYNMLKNNISKLIEEN